jgi:hypothetical protein
LSGYSAEPHEIRTRRTKTRKSLLWSRIWLIGRIANT